MSRVEGARRIAAKYPTRFLRSYVRSKLVRDPMYEAVLSHVANRADPLLDIGCGVGVLEAWLREQGARMPVVAIDSDEGKIAVARQLALADVTFSRGDATTLPPFHGTVVILDVLHYLTSAEQQAVLAQVIDRSSGLVIVREAVRDRSMRYRVTVAEERFARAVRWLRVPRLNFPRAEEIVEPFHARGFEISVAPMWGRTPLNNYLFVFNRASSGTTKS